MEEGDELLVGFFTSVCAAAVENGEGVVVAVENGYSMTPHPASDVFLAVDALSARNPDSTFRNGDLATLLDDAVLPTVGLLSASADDAESYALRTGYARDRVMAYQRCKSAALAACTKSASESDVARLRALPVSVREDLVSCEQHVMKRTGEAAEAAQHYNAAKRSAWNASMQFDRALSMMDNADATGISRQQIVGLATGEWNDNHADVAESDDNMGTERFVSFVFAPPDHKALAAANATGGGVRCSESRIVYPAYVTVHNSKGAIDHLPATATEQRPNSVIVPCAASLLCELHALSTKAGRNHVMIAHKIKLQ